MLAERDLDLVIVATPDHWHALPMIAAVEAGADVYVEKPVSVDVVEARAMVAAARKHGRVVQVGTQRRRTPHLVEAREEIVRSGRLGRVGQVEIQGYFPLEFDTNPPDAPPTATLDYDSWTGPAPMRPFNTLPPSTTATCRSSGRTSTGAPLPTRGTPGEPRSSGTRAPSRPPSTPTTSSRSGAAGPFTCYFVKPSRGAT